jgi:putative ABC transport system permease protein
MIKHLCKLVWNRRRINFLITLEIFISFLVVFAVTVLTVYYADNYSHPLGFDYSHVWNVHVDMKRNEELKEEEKLEQMTKVRQLLAATREFGEVQTVAASINAPYSRGNWSSGRKVNGHEVHFLVNSVTDDFKDVFGIKLVRGRWFGKEDDGANYIPVVINRQLSRDAYGDADPIGKTFNETREKYDQDSPEERVIGVIDDFRKNGEFAELRGYYITRNALIADGKQHPPLNTLVIKVAPGTTAAFEEKLLKRLQAEAKDWSFTIKPITQMREELNQQSTVPMTAFALVAGFLMLMVGLGLIGVLWQSVTQRLKEIGLRRAKGATRERIYRQILGELLIITTCGALVGVLVVVQFPLLGVLGFASPKVYTYSVLISLALIYALTALCGLYPSWLATKVHPAEALHYE